MPDYRRMYDDKEHLYAYDLPAGKDVIVQIERCTGGEVTGERGKKNKKPIVSFVGEKKKLALNKTNGKTIAKLYGTDTDNWKGKWIKLFATTTEFGGETVDCIRVRPHVPDAPSSRGRKDAGPQLEANTASAATDDATASEGGNAS